MDIDAELQSLIDKTVLLGGRTIKGRGRLYFSYRSHRALLEVMHRNHERFNAIEPRENITHYAGVPFVVCPALEGFVYIHPAVVDGFIEKQPAGWGVSEDASVNLGAAIACDDGCPRCGDMLIAVNRLEAQEEEGEE